MADAYASWAERYLEDPTPPPIDPERITALALEGGGGKGNAYLGALFALEQLGVLPRLTTVAGSSAGAITAMALSLGMKPAEIYTFIATTDFGAFFDDVSDARPTVGKPYERPEHDERAKRKEAASQLRPVLLYYTFWGKVIAAAARAVASTRTSVLQAMLEARFRAEDVVHGINALFMPSPGAPPRRPPSAPAELPPSLATKVLGKLVDSSSEYGVSLSYDMGLFSGQAARDTLARLVGDRVTRKADEPPGSENPRPAEQLEAAGRYVTFRLLDQRCETFGLPKLRVTGSELCATRSTIFSGATTPEFPVADAVRISMGLPIVYKPYTIKKARDGYPPCGVYVDGGVYSNLPMNAYSDEEAATALGLRLEVDKPAPIHGLLTFLQQVFKGSLLAGESTVTSDRSRRCIRLDTDPLDTLGFEVAPDVLSKVARRAHLTTMLYFGRKDDYKPIDVRTGRPLEGNDAAAATQAALDDLQESIKRRRAAAGCVFAEQAAPARSK
jgi:predicted acylesterase/phospholipase RssA